MRFYDPAKEQSCYYCRKIKTTEVEQGYPIREGIYTYENYIFRCAWHARFRCEKCGEEFHFSWLFWCPKKQRLECGDCTKPTMKPVLFWDRTYAYQFYCKECEENHYDLLYAEFQGTHPWQAGLQKIQSNIQEKEPWNPIWAPKAKREGREIQLAEALKLPNRVIELREELNYIQFGVRKHLVPQDQVDISDTQNSWEFNSKDWLEKHPHDMQGDINRQFVIDPALWALIGNVKDLTVLDAGCGNGYLTRMLATKGAKTIGVDFSKNFINYCKKIELEQNMGCKFIQASITDMNEIKSKSIDIIVSNVVMVDIVDYKKAFKEIARILKDDGRFIWSNVHPIFGRGGAIDVKLPRDSPRNEARYLKMVDRYFDSGGELIDWMSKPSWQFIRTLEEYSKALKEAGFVISEILEPRPTSELIQQNPRTLAFDSDRWTHFIIFECLKR